MSIISQFIFQKTLERIPQRSFILAWEENGLSSADMRWPSAIMKHRPTRQTTGSIRLPHRHTSFPKGWPGLPQSPPVSEGVWQPVEKDKEMGLQRELAATASARLCLRGLLQEPGLWKTPHHHGELCGCQGTIMVLEGPGEIGSWSGQYLAVMDNTCRSSHIGHGIPSVLFCGRIFVWLFFLMETSWATVNFLKPPHCVCIHHQEDLQLEILVPACSCSLSFSILVKLPSLELSVMH